MARGSHTAEGVAPPRDAPLRGAIGLTKFTEDVSIGLSARSEEQTRHTDRAPPAGEKSNLVQKSALALKPMVKVS